MCWIVRLASHSATQLSNCLKPVDACAHAERLWEPRGFREDSTTSTSPRWIVFRLRGWHARAYSDFQPTTPKTERRVHFPTGWLAFRPTPPLLYWTAQCERKGGME